jgi:hypothetical protein
MIEVAGSVVSANYKLQAHGAIHVAVTQSGPVKLLPTTGQVLFETMKESGRQKQFQWSVILKQFFTICCLLFTIYYLRTVTAQSV